MKNKKTIINGIVLLLIGAGFLLGDFFKIKSDISFLSNSEKTEGSVVNIIKNLGDGKYMYRPEISFIDNTGKTITFISEVSSSISTYKEGEKVPVLYNKNNSQKAKINTFFQLWGGVAVLTFMGIISFWFGLFVLINQIKKSILKKSLLSKGTKIFAKVISVDSLNPQSKFSQLNMLKNQTYQIVAQWLNPNNNEMYIFKSDPLSYNPESLILNNDIGVFIDSVNPKRYYVDISTLPKVGN
jgi:hypothetical protein